MTVNIQKAGTDLASVLKPFATGMVKPAATGIQSGGSDLINLFAGAQYGTAAAAIHYTKSGTDVGPTFAAISTGYTPNTITITATGSQAVPAGVQNVQIEIIGAPGGGGGGSMGSGKAGVKVGGGSGGLAGNSVITLTASALVPGTSISITIGAAGTVGANAATLGGTATGGGTGGTTTVSATGMTTMTVAGGGGGGGAASTVVGPAGAAGATPTNSGATNTAGAAGNPGTTSAGGASKTGQPSNIGGTAGRNSGAGGYAWSGTTGGSTPTAASGGAVVNIHFS